MELSPLLKASLLYRQSYRVLNKIVSTVLIDFNMTPIEWAFLSTIYHKDGITVSELAAILSVEVPMITQLSLQRNVTDLIVMKRSTTDKRIKTMHLKPTAKKLMQKIEKKLDEVLGELFKNVSAKDVTTHLKVLQAIADKA